MNEKLNAPDVRPDVHEAVVEAIEVAESRGMPLAEPVPDAKNRPLALPPMLSGAAPWNQLPLDALTGARRVDIMRSLAGIAGRMKPVEAEIERLITTPVKLIADIASHTLGAGGKRLRPALTLLCAQLCGDDGDLPIPLVVTCAAAVELTHTTTLLHDDVVDEAEVRRGKPAANLIWGSETSVLVGDYLFAQVFVTAAQKGFAELMYPLAHATAQMCAGELLETQTRGNLEMSEKQYCEIIALKTASLTDCACRLGALAMKAPDEQVERLARFGRDIGMAFQIVDDVFDIVATEGKMGKPVGNDIREGDVTLPMLRAMQVCSESEKSQLRTILKRATGSEPLTKEEVEIALSILRSCDAVPYAARVANEFIQSAKSQLEHFPDSPPRQMLLDIADYVTSREK